jgi:hypothetical protein
MRENREISSTPWSDDQGRSAKATSRNADMHVYEALDFVAQGKVKTIVETYALAEAPKAYQLVEGKTGSAPSSQCNRRFEQSPMVSGGSRGIFPGIRLGKSCGRNQAPARRRTRWHSAPSAPDADRMLS